VRPAEANRPEREAGGLLDRGRASALRIENQRGAGARTKNVRWQKSVRRIARRPARGAARRVVGAALANELSAHCADAHGGGSEVRTVREPATLSYPRASVARRPGKLGRARHDGRRPDCSRVTTARGRRGDGLGRAGQHEAAPKGVRQSSCPSVLEPARRCPRRRRRASEIGTCTVKAAPADEARAVIQPRRREAPALEMLG